MTISLELDDDGRLGKYSCTMLLFEVKGTGNCERTIREIIDAGVQLKPSRHFGGEANALVIRTEAGRPRLPLGYLLALGQVAGELIQRAKKKRPNRPDATVWATYHNGTPEPAFQANCKSDDTRQKREQRICENPPGRESERTANEADDNTAKEPRTE